MDWHKRYLQQARWTRQLRQYAYNKLGFEHLQRVLDLGCGTGVILSELPSFTPADCFGLDISLPNLVKASTHSSQAILTCGDAHRLPYTDGAFDAVLCHFTLLWLTQPKTALDEMVRVTRSAGVVLALAEPDYSGRIDFPSDLETLGRAQARSLSKQGADTETGRKLSALLHGAGLTQIETGILSGLWNARPTPADLEIEWQVLEADLKDSDLDLGYFWRLDELAWADGSRTLFVPTFYGWGVKP